MNKEMNIDLEGWRERIDNLLDVQKDLQLPEVRMTFNRKDLIELRLIINSLDDYICREQAKGGNNGTE